MHDARSSLLFFRLAQGCQLIIIYMFGLGSDYDDIKRGRSIYISPNGIDGWTRMSPLNTRLGPKVIFTTVEERNAQLVCRRLFPFFACSFCGTPKLHSY